MVLKFLIAAVVVLPLLPDRTYGPLQVINPFKSGLMIVLIAGISPRSRCRDSPCSCWCGR